MTGVLPPGIEKVHKDVYGVLKLSIKDLQWLNNATNYDFIKIRPIFWGEKEQQRLLRAQNTCLDEFGVIKHEAYFEIRCNIVQFFRYLRDMAKLRLHLVDKRNNKAFGMIMINFLLYLKQEVTEKDDEPFERIFGVFPVTKMPKASEKESFPAKIGDIEIEIACDFTKGRQLKKQRELEKAKKEAEDKYSGDKNLEKVKLDATVGSSERKPHSLEPGNENYKNPFDLTLLDADKGASQRHPANQRQSNQSYDVAIDDLISGGMELRKRMMASEKNKDLDVSSAIEDLLQSSSNASAIFDTNKNMLPREDTYKQGSSPVYAYKPVVALPRSKDAELEAIRLRMDYPADYDRPQAVRKPTPAIEQRTDYSDIKRHRLFVKAFKALNPLLNERLRGKQVSLEVRYPVLLSNRPLPPEVYKFLTDEDYRQDQFMVNQEVDSELDLQKVGVQKLCSNRVGFILWMKSQEPATRGKDLEVCRGELALEQILLSPSFELKVNLPMRIVLDTDRTKKVSVPKADVKNLEVMTADAGILAVETKFYNPELERLRQNNQGKEIDEAVEAISKAIDQHSTSRNHTIRDLSANPICLYLHVKDARCIPRQDPASGNRNLYLEHKVYGTADSIRSEVYWNNNCPVMDHKVTIPLDANSFEMMKNVPLTLAVWDKNTDPSKQADDLVGYCKVGLQSGYTTFGQISQEKIAELVRRQGDSLIEIASGQIPVRGIALNDDRGLLIVSASVGSVRQIRAAIEDNDVDTYGRDRYQRTKRQNTFDSREEEDVNETASDKDLPEGDISSDESVKLQREIKEKKRLKKEKLKTLKEKTKKHIKKTESNVDGSLEEEIDEEYDEEPSEEEEEVVKPSPKRPKSNRGEKPQTNKPVTSKKESPQRKPSSSKEYSSPRYVNEPSERLGSVNDAKIVLKPGDKELIHDKKTGQSFQKLPTGEVVELKKMSMKNIDGTTQTVYINPTIDPSMAKKRNLSREDIEQLMAIEQSIKAVTDVMPKSKRQLTNPDELSKIESMKQIQSQKNLQSGTSRASLPKSVKKTSRNQFDIQEEGSSRISKPQSSKKSRKQQLFEYQEGDSEAEEEEEYSEDSEEEGIEMQILGKSKTKSIKEGSKPLNSFRDPNGNKHTKSRSQVQTAKSIASKSDINTPLMPTKSAHGVITQKSEVESQEEDQERSSQGKNFGADQDNSAMGGISTILQPRMSKLENAKNLKVPVKVGTSSRTNEIYTPKSNVVSKFSFPDKSKRSDLDQSRLSRIETRPNLKLPAGLIDSRVNSETPSPRNQGVGSKQDQVKPSTESPSEFFMDKKQPKNKIPEASFEDSGKNRKPATNGRLQEYTEEISDLRKRDEVPQFETILPEDFFCDDLIMSLTMILEYFRRFIFMHTALSERMDNLYLGQYQQQLAEFISFTDLEYIMEHYNVFITRTELESLFSFLDYEDKGEISLSDLHESLVAYLQFYETITFEFYEGMKVLHKKIKDSLSLEEFKDYVVDNSERYHIRREHLIDYVENYLELSNPLVNQTIATCGEFIYFDSCYYFNILNYLLFIEHFVGENLSFEYVNALHHYSKFKSLIEVKLLFLMYEVYKVQSPDGESLRASLLARYNKITDRLPHRINFKQFRLLLKEMKLSEITAWESMILFKQCLEDTQALTQDGFSKHSLLNKVDAFRMLENLTQDKRGIDAQTGESQVAQSLLIDKFKKRNNQVAGEKFVYRYDIAVEFVDDLRLNRCDYCDLSVMYQFPGESEAIESQIFTYIPDEHSSVLLPRLQCWTQLDSLLHAIEEERSGGALRQDEWVESDSNQAVQEAKGRNWTGNHPRRRFDKSWQ